MTSDVEITRFKEVRINANSNDRRSRVTAVSRGLSGADGAPGEGVIELEPRIEALEEATDGEVNNIDMLQYYLLARGN